MNYLKNIPPFLFFTGKGGVGKTSIACASAVQLADQGKKVLLVSTDPASNVAQVFDQAIGHKITKIASVTNLFAIEVDPQAAAEGYRQRIVEPVRGILPDDVVAGIEEQLSGACTTEIAAFDEFTALLTDTELRKEYEHIVFDTAPTGHTIRMLQLPGAWSGFLEDSPEGASCLGPLAGLEKQQVQYKEAVNALADSKQTRMILVARAQTAALNEVSRTHDELAALGLKQQHLVINGVLPKSEADLDTLAMAVYEREQTALSHIPANLKNLPLDQLSLKPFNLVGLEALKGLLKEGAPIDFPSEKDDRQKVNVPSLTKMIDELAKQDHGLIMLMGKGGVGKTTLAAAIAVKLASRGHQVHLSTSDPAAHLSSTLEGSLENLEVSRIDPVVETERYRQHVLEQQGKNLDETGRAVLEEDLRSPCTEEIAVFQAFSRIIRDAGEKFVVMDTAPTVTEAAHLQEDLRRAGIEPWGWIINNSLVNSDTQSPLLQQRAAQEKAQIDAVTKKHAKRVALVPLQEREPVGVKHLQELAES